MTCGFVLLPGGGMSDWVWKKLIPLLDAKAVCVPRRIEDNTYENRLNAHMNDIIEYADKIIEASGFGEVVLVGHSGAGMLAGMLGKMNRRVLHVVFVAANIPGDGKTALDGLPEDVRAKNIESVKMQAAYDSIPMRVMEQNIRALFCNTCSEDDIEYVLEQYIQPEPVCVLTERMNWIGYPNIGKTYVVCTQDKMLPETEQYQTAAAANLDISDIRRIPSDHMVMLSHPAELAACLNEVISRYAPGHPDR